MRNLYKPNRFKVAGIQAQQTLGGDVMQADEEGNYVEFRDYRRALDEIEMMKHTVKYWEIEAQTDHARWLRTLEDSEKLKAEVERLRKAGDELLREWSSGDETDGRNFKKGLVIWNAAKEGKQS